MDMLSKGRLRYFSPYKGTARLPKCAGLCGKQIHAVLSGFRLFFGSKCVIIYNKTLTDSDIKNQFMCCRSGGGYSNKHGHVR